MLILKLFADLEFDFDEGSAIIEIIHLSEGMWQPAETLEKRES